MRVERAGRASPQRPDGGCGGLALANPRAPFPMPVSGEHLACGLNTMLQGGTVCSGQIARHEVAGFPEVGDNSPRA
ncbi:MAG: hypothetical protein GMKNLPBB_01831 [Myxococcota bacterium]|nr:hypothetical protein [Myxococcota bacterium]